MSDLIDRQAAIDAILHITNCKSVRELFEYNQLHHLTEMWSGGVNDAIDAVIGVDSAQLGTNLAEVGTRAVRGYPIDADALMENVAEEYGERARDTLYRIIRDMPPAQPEQRTGKWIMNDHIGTFKIFTCDKCGWNSEAPFNFCPNCGDKKKRVAERREDG